MIKYWKRPVPTDSETYFSCFVCWFVGDYGFGGSIGLMAGWGLSTIMASTIHPFCCLHTQRPPAGARKRTLPSRGLIRPGYSSPKEMWWILFIWVYVDVHQRAGLPNDLRDNVLCVYAYVYVYTHTGEALNPNPPVGDVEEGGLGGDELVDVPPVLDDGVPEGDVEVAGHLFFFRVLCVFFP